MAISSVLAELKEEHDRLYRMILTQHAARTFERQPEERVKADQLAGGLIARLQAAADQEMSIEDYDWLSGALINWQVAAAFILRRPRDIAMPLPPQLLHLEKSRSFLSDDDLETFLRAKAGQLAQARKSRELVERLEALTRQPSSEGEILQDWQGALAHLGYEILSGQKDFPRRLTGQSYRHLEEVWLDEIKEVWAYLLWKGDGAPVGGDELKYYFEACEAFHRHLFSPAIAKGSGDDLVETRAFIDSQYLAAGRLAWPPGGRALRHLKLKAARLWQRHGGPDEENWAEAESYMKAYYENIVPAVVEAKAADRRPHAERVLGALARYEDIVSGLEAAIAVYFLDGDLMRELAPRYWSMASGE